METPNHCQSSASSEGCSSTHLKPDSINGQMDTSKLEPTNDVEPVDKVGNCPKKSDSAEASRALEDGALASSADISNNLDCSKQSGLQAELDASDGDPCKTAAPIDDVRAVETEGNGSKDLRSANDCDGSVVVRTKECGNSSTKLLQESSSREHSLGHVNDSATHLSRIEDAEHVDEVEEHISAQSTDHPADVYKFSKLEIGTKGHGLVRKKTNVELYYDMVDPLELARQVAREVEREVGDRREQSCSSSDAAPESGSRIPDSPDSAHETESQPREESSEEVPAGEDLSAETSELRDDPAISAESVEAKPVMGRQERECSQVTEVAEEQPANSEKGLCDFDLNQEVCSEDMDRQENPISTPISVVSASRASAAPGLPITPLQFEGSLGWKGSAATSAFRPASPRRIPDGDKANSTGGSNGSSKQRDGCLDIDLNVDESVDDKTAYPLMEKQIPGSSGLPSGESSVEVGPRISERLDFDLNRVTDDGDAPTDWRTEVHLVQQRNGYRSRSPSSSSSSKHPSLRNIDLNDQPSFANESSDNPYLIKLSQNFNAPGVKKSNETVISIMGMKVEVNRKDFVPHSHPLLNGRNPEPALDVNLARTGSILGIGSAVPYSHSPLYGYNGLASGPTVALSTGIYGPGGPIPSYMLDSRGAPVIPQVIGTAPAVPPSFSQPPFMMSITGIPGSNGAGPSRTCFDLNSGIVLEGGNRENGVLRQFLNPGQQTRSIDDHQLKSSPQLSSSSGIGMKRKEPELGWGEPYPFKHHHPPTWK